MTRHTPPFGHPSQEGNFENPYSPCLTKIERDVSGLFFLDANKNPEVVPLEEQTIQLKDQSEKLKEMDQIKPRFFAKELLLYVQRFLRV